MTDPAPSPTGGTGPEPFSAGHLTYLDHGDLLVHTLCHECFIRVGYPRDRAQEEEGRGWVELGLISSHDGEWRGGLWQRLRMAWKLLRGQHPWWFDLNTAEEADGLISALNLARGRAFGPLPSLPALHGLSGNSATQEFHIDV